MNTAKTLWTIGAGTTLVFAALLLIARPARADSFEGFSATGSFLDAQFAFEWGFHCR